MNTDTATLPSDEASAILRPMAVALLRIIGSAETRYPSLDRDKVAEVAIASSLAAAYDAGAEAALAGRAVCFEGGEVTRRPGLRIMSAANIVRMLNALRNRAEGISVEILHGNFDGDETAVVVHYQWWSHEAPPPDCPDCGKPCSFEVGGAQHEPPIPRGHYCADCGTEVESDPETVYSYPYRGAGLEAALKAACEGEGVEVAA